MNSGHARSGLLLKILNSSRRAVYTHRSAGWNVGRPHPQDMWTLCVRPLKYICMQTYIIFVLEMAAVDRIEMKNAGDGRGVCAEDNGI